MGFQAIISEFSERISIRGFGTRSPSANGYRAWDILVTDMLSAVPNTVTAASHDRPACRSPGCIKTQRRCNRCRGSIYWQVIMSRPRREKGAEHACPYIELPARSSVTREEIEIAMVRRLTSGDTPSLGTFWI